ncbi:class I SAM-dependent methyltransferase [Streptomyces acidiscabies]|uniref:Class I SAM-dependent methyltransferase n=1 Tax=Streptomyces acidiscabies TaxID=42234 RepID=A0AAP6BC22_9ACTN|nr:class I SAM-dependent methyltransferase [Streptomyces acidiscabies]MBP5942640.1 class I SAM-dependent methyltransferase [Streptomyces sp. LBUM 1476]MBZ3917898.1 class I SAM-dependent methyltransferase [Streptomyces acidiscabies]MDX2961868.1 class I SAM-dependent methyltransferase [Streptomyces acidiscabies]MDX3023385.1 class I SAM-dependent methyltransferase [Streptomyces acidiscabies]MDX3789409.1 class I SAM-dependent methyltransferase [Streptomyces acidiscabies]
MPDAYERHLVPVFFRPFAEDLAARAAALRPGRILELAAGTGALTSALLAALPGASVVATDLNEAMVGAGSVREPRAVWRQADAQRLPFGDGEFDLVVCQFGVMFFPDRPAAYAEVRRVLAPRGRFLFNSWGPLASHGFGSAFQTALEESMPDGAPSFLADVPHGYADPAVVAADLTAAGLFPAGAEEVTLDGVAESAASVATGFLTGTPVSATVGVREDAQTIQDAVTRRMTQRLGAGPVTAAMTATVYTAHREG